MKVNKEEQKTDKKENVKDHRKTKANVPKFLDFGIWDCCFIIIMKKEKLLLVLVLVPFWGNLAWSNGDRT